MRIGLSNLKRGITLLLMFLVGCGPVGSTPTPSSSPTVVACTPAAGNINIYRNYAPSYESIYQYAWIPSGAAGAPTLDAQALATLQAQILSPGFNPQNLPAAQYNAFLTLVEQVEKSSDYVDLEFGDNFLVRITITFVSPSLVESVVLNQILNSSNLNRNYQAEVKNAEENIARRDEILFLVTVAASKDSNKLAPNDSLTVDIPVKRMILTSSSGETVEPYHFDPHIEYPIKLHADTEHGYLEYPLAVMVNGNCFWLTDPTWNTVLTIYAPELFISDTKYDPATWNIDYHPLVGLSTQMPVLSTPPPNSHSHSPFDTAPFPAIEMETSTAYWEEMALYVWFHLTDLKSP